MHGDEALDEEDGSITNTIKMDSQAKYGLVSRGEAQVCLRLPKPECVKWMWDHAAGSLIIAEAGGKVTDVNGNRLDFSLKVPNMARKTPHGCGTPTKTQLNN